MFDDIMSPRDDGSDDDRLDDLIAAANAALVAAGIEPIGEAEGGIVGDMCDDTFMTVPEVVEFIKADRANRVAQGIPGHAL